MVVRAASGGDAVDLLGCGDDAVAGVCGAEFELIENAGISQAEAAKLIETSQSRIALLINGGGNISPGDLVMLADKLGFEDEGYKESLRELRRDNHKRGFWTTGHNRAYSEDLRLLVDLDDLMSKVDDGGLALSGDGGLLPEMVKAVLERGLQAETSGL